MDPNAHIVKNMTRDQRMQLAHGKALGTGKSKKNPSHTHGGHSQAFGGWTCDDGARFKGGEPTKSAGLAPFRVQMPKGRIRYVRTTN